MIKNEMLENVCNEKERGRKKLRPRKIIQKKWWSTGHRHTKVNGLNEDDDQTACHWCV
jgi:hypothetical protein